MFCNADPLVGIYTGDDHRRSIYKREELDSLYSRIPELKAIRSSVVAGKNPWSGTGKDFNEETISSKCPTSGNAFRRCYSTFVTQCPAGSPCCKADPKCPGDFSADSSFVDGCDTIGLITKVCCESVTIAYMI